MGGGASKKAFNLCELLRRDDKEEEAAEFIEKANPKTFVLGEYDGRIPFALAAKLGKARFVKQMFARDEDRQYLYGMYLDGALLSSCEGQTDSGNFLHTLRFANIKKDSVCKSVYNLCDDDFTRMRLRVCLGRVF